MVRIQMRIEWTLDVLLLVLQLVLWLNFRVLSSEEFKVLHNCVISGWEMIDCPQKNDCCKEMCGGHRAYLHYCGTFNKVALIQGKILSGNLCFGEPDYLVSGIRHMGNIISATESVV